jgi:phosphoribosylanthranilate isomerase
MRDIPKYSFIKICGITSADDARSISGTGIDYLGVIVNVARSPRSLRIEMASAIIAASRVPVIALTYDHHLDHVLAVIKELQPAAVQLAGTESEESIASLRDKTDIELWKSVHIPTRDTGGNASGELAAHINRLARIGINTFVLDTALRRGASVIRGGTGQQCDWSLAAAVRNQVDAFLFLAGGITPHNVRDAMRQVNPDGIDVSSGVEATVGRKDPARVAHLVAQARTEMSTTP